MVMPSITVARNEKRGNVVPAEQRSGDTLQESRYSIDSVNNPGGGQFRVRAKGGSPLYFLSRERSPATSAAIETI